MQANREYPTRDASLIGAAGVHTVVAELNLRGLIALPTIRNTAGVDVLVTNVAGTWHANLQVKSSRSRVTFWPIGSKYLTWKGEKNFYVFLRFVDKLQRFEIFLETADKVAENCTAGVKREKEKGLKAWTPCFYPRGNLDYLKTQWTAFGPPSPTP
jgi:hypothetical protein